MMTTPTPIESWLLTNALTIITLVILGVMAWARTGTASEVKKELEAHKSCATPHPSCPLHDSILTDIKATLTRIDRRLFRLASGRSIEPSDKEEDEA